MSFRRRQPSNLQSEMGLSLPGAETPFIISTPPACACGSLSLAQPRSHKVARAYFTNAGEPAQTCERFPTKKTVGDVGSVCSDTDDCLQFGVFFSDRWQAHPPAVK